MLSSHRIVELGWMYTRRLPTPEGVRTWEIHEVNIPNALEGYWLVVGYTGVHSSTAKQVDLVSSLIKSKPEMKNVLHAIGQVTERGVKYLQEGDLEGVGRSMTENHILLRALGVSCPELEALIDAALPTSLGAKLTGSGGGGCMIALTLNPKETSEAIELAGGRTFISAFGSEGLRCEEYLDSASWNPFN